MDTLSMFSPQSLVVSMKFALWLWPLTLLAFFFWSSIAAAIAVAGKTGGRMTAIVAASGLLLLLIILSGGGESPVPFDFMVARTLKVSAALLAILFPFLALSRWQWIRGRLGTSIAVCVFVSILTPANFLDTQCRFVWDCF